MKVARQHRLMAATTAITIVAGLAWVSTNAVGAGDLADIRTERTEQIVPGEKLVSDSLDEGMISSFADRRAMGIPQFTEVDQVPEFVPRARAPRGEESEVVDKGVEPPFVPLPDATAPTLGLNFEGARIEDSGYIPPDTMGAIGPNHFMEVINGVVQIYDRSDGSLISSETLTSFFTGCDYASFVGDPRVLFDQHSDRWIAICSDFDDRICLAVSTSDDPTGSFFVTGFVAASGSDAGTMPDYPTLGVDENGIYTAAYMYGNGSISVFAIDKAPLIAPSPSLGTVTAWRGLPLSYGDQPAHTYGTPGAEYIIGKESSSSLHIYRVDPPLTNPTMTDTGNVSVESFVFPPDAPAQGSSVLLDTVGDRLMMSVYRDGSLWTTHCVSINGRAAARWYEIDPVTRSVIQWGNVPDSTLYYFFPSLMVNSLGDVVMGFSGSSSSQYAACYYTGRRSTDPEGEMASPELLKAGEAAYQLLDGWGRNRWGDYSYTTLDPVDEATFWTIQEYAETPDQYNSAWGTWIGELSYGDLICDGIGDDTWDGCRGNGCAVCQEKLAGYDCYFINHPQCYLNITCGGWFFDCDAACPEPTAADECVCDGSGDDTWDGCRGNGCAVCEEQLVGYDLYFERHPQCVLNTTCDCTFYDCDAACPAPTEKDQRTCDGIGDGTWDGCRGNGCAVCEEKLVGYDCYFKNHPQCDLNTTCGGSFYDCDAGCPEPTALDQCVCDGIGDCIWDGCRGNGCAVCAEKLVGYDCYFERHPQCVLNTTCNGEFYACDAACPPPTEGDKCPSGPGPDPEPKPVIR